MILGIVFQAHHWPTLLSPSAHGRGYCSWWVSHQITCTWANENEEVNCWLWNGTVFQRFSSCEICVFRSVSAGYSPVTCSRAVDAASFRPVGSGGRTSAGAFTSLGNPGHTFRILDPQKRGHHPCRPTSSAGVTATSRLTPITKLCVILWRNRNMLDFDRGVVETKGKLEGSKHERRLWERCCPMSMNTHCVCVSSIFCWCLQNLKLYFVYSYHKISKSLCFG